MHGVTVADESDRSPPFWGDRAHRVTLAVSLGLWLAAFAPTLVFLVHVWLEQPDYSHGLLMPPIAAWLAWQKREEFARLAPRASLLGALLLVPFLLLLVVGELDFLVSLRPYALVGSLAALSWAFYGTKVFKPLFPILVVLLLMCPLPGPIERGLTYPLKSTAAVFATGMLDLTGIRATLDGSVIHLPGIDELWVADACSGIRSLISLASLAILACLFWKVHWALRLAVVLASAPIAILVNGLRIWLTGWLSVHVSPATAQGFFHMFEGFVMFGVAGLLLWGFAMALQRMVRTVRA